MKGDVRQFIQSVQAKAMLTNRWRGTTPAHIAIHEPQDDRLGARLPDLFGAARDRRSDGTASAMLGIGQRWDTNTRRMSRTVPEDVFLCVAIAMSIS